MSAEHPAGNARTAPAPRDNAPDVAYHERLGRLLERAREQITCHRDVDLLGGDECPDRLRREEWCDACAVRADVEHEALVLAGLLEGPAPCP